MKFICHNGKMIDAAAPVLLADNRGFKYGDGVFETMKMKESKIDLEEHHYHRLFKSLQLLQIDFPLQFKEQLSSNLLQLAQLNKCTSLAKIRLAVFRGENGQGEYVIEATTLTQEVTNWNEAGWTIDIYPDARKSCDAFANLKTANFLPYVMAGLYAKEHKLDECLVLNTTDFICDGSRTNIFLVLNKEIQTPALHQGCVDGVMRRFVIDHLKKLGHTIKQTQINVDLLLQADEVFVTNAVQGIRWVKSFRTKNYQQSITRQLYTQLFSGRPV